MENRLDQLKRHSERAGFSNILIVRKKSSELDCFEGRATEIHVGIDGLNVISTCEYNCVNIESKKKQL